MDTILVVVNRISKLANVAPTKMIAITFNSTKLLFDMWVRHLGMLQFTVNDKDAKFIASF